MTLSKVSKDSTTGGGSIKLRESKSCTTLILTKLLVYLLTSQKILVIVDLKKFLIKFLQSDQIRLEGSNIRLIDENFNIDFNIIVVKSYLKGLEFSMILEMVPKSLVKPKIQSPSLLQRTTPPPAILELPITNPSVLSFTHPYME